MNIEQLLDYCLSKPYAGESMPFGDDTLVFKVKTKMFALANLEGPLSINLKCDPELALELRERYRAVVPGYHMNKKHWNSVIINGSISDDKIIEWIDHSYEVVCKTLPGTKK